MILRRCCRSTQHRWTPPTNSSSLSSTPVAFSSAFVDSSSVCCACPSQSCAHASAYTGTHRCLAPTTRRLVAPRSFACLPLCVGRIYALCAGRDQTAVVFGLATRVCKRRGCKRCTSSCSSPLGWPTGASWRS